MKLTIVTAVVLSSIGVAHAEGCNVADVLFGQVRIEIIKHNTEGDIWETGIIKGNDTNGGRFAYDKILGQIDLPQRDGSRNISNNDGELCGTIEKNMSITTNPRDSACVGTWCGRPISLRKVTPGNFAVLANGSIHGTIEGRLPK